LKVRPEVLAVAIVAGVVATVAGERPVRKQVGIGTHEPSFATVRRPAQAVKLRP